MPKKTPEELKAEAAEIDELLTTARKKPLNFALLLASEGIVLKAHLTKEPETLWRQAKAAGGSSKGTMGVMNVTGKVIALTCETDDFPGNLPRRAKAHLRDLGLSVRVEMTLPNGAVLSDEDGDEADEDSGEEETVAAEGGAEDSAVPAGILQRAELLERLKALVPKVKLLGEKDPERAEKLVNVMRLAQGELAANRFDTAVKAMDAIDRALIPAPPPMPPAQAQPAPPKAEDVEAERQKVKAAFAALAPNLAVFIKRAEPSLAGKARQLAAAFNAGIEGPDLKRMAQVVLALKNFLDVHFPQLPAVSAAERAKDALAAAAGQPIPAARYEKAMATQKKYGRGGVAAADAYDSFAGVLGDQAVTPQLLADALSDIAAVKGEMAGPAARRKAAEALPPGTARDQAVAAAQMDVDAAQAKIDAAVAFEKAARGKVALDAALSYGPLSANSGQAFKDETAARLIAAFTRDPDLAVAGVAAAATGKYPDAVAEGLDGVIAGREASFAHGDQKLDAATSEKYAKQLLSMGAEVGPDYFARMDGYMKSGRQFEPDPLGDAAFGNKTRKAQVRSVALAKGMLKPDGTVDVASAEARQAMGDLLFSPIALTDPMPALNEHALKTVAMLSDPANAGKANTILGGMAAPAGGSSALVRRATGKGAAAAVGTQDARTAVMASMLKSMDQGPVGSCFATAPMRKMRETDPLAAMQIYADVATKGTVKPANSPEVPVVTKIPANEDPIMRSAEYSLAQSIARTAGSSERQHLDDLLQNGMSHLGVEIQGIAADAVANQGGTLNFLKGVGKLFGIPGTIKQMKQEVSDAFDFVYDPTSAIAASADGSSSQGRYVLVRKDTGAEVTSEAEFLAVVKEKALAVSGFDPASPDADRLRASIADPAFVDRVKTSKSAPWAMRGGGYGEPASQALFGKKLKSNEVAAAGKPTDTEGARTAEVVSKLLAGLDGVASDLVTLETEGQHAFNATPKDPSLAKLLAGGKGKIAANVKTHLVDKGQAIAAAKLPVEQAQGLFDKLMSDFEAANGTPAAVAALRADAATHRPTAEMTPAEVERAVAEASDGFLDVIASTRADPVGAKAGFKAWASNKTKTGLIKDLAVEEFTIADTNWGDQGNHVFFVVAPDPTTGEPIMWKKTVPPGNLVPAGRDWIDRKWTMIK